MSDRIRRRRPSVQYFLECFGAKARLFVDGTGWGPGPKSSLSQRFPGKNIDTDNALVMLAHAADDGSRDEGLDFPYHLLPDNKDENKYNKNDEKQRSEDIGSSAPRKRMKSSETRQKRHLYCV